MQNSSITISIQAMDNTAIKKISIFISGSDFPIPSYSAMTPMEGNIYQYSFTPSIPGERTFSIAMEDIAGNVAYVTGSFTVAALPNGGEGGNPALDYFAKYLLAPLLAAVIAAVIVALLMRLHYTKKVESKISELETTLKTMSKAKSKADKGS